MNQTTQAPVAETSLAICGNCLNPIENHPENGCVVGAMFKVLHDRGEMEPSELQRLHDLDRHWDEIGLLVDEMANGDFTAA
ncbi:MAG: hypothetical protein EKK45_12750 [Curvibacter sp.]|nr:MAG: hypothetical protein EKK45_12750 [Curvibacter sp.]